jgi:hypothetical protein
MNCRLLRTVISFVFTSVALSVIKKESLSVVIVGEICPSSLVKNSCVINAIHHRIFYASFNIVAMLRI